MPAFLLEGDPAPVAAPAPVTISPTEIEPDILPLSSLPGLPSEVVTLPPAFGSLPRPGGPPPSPQQPPAILPAALPIAASLPPLDQPIALQPIQAPVLPETPAEVLQPPPVALAEPLETGPRLPESYGTRRLFLTARDPHWLHADWDLSQDEIDQCNAQAANGHLTLRVHVDAISETPFLQIELTEEARSWFVLAGRGATSFLAELGFTDRGGQWRPIAVSQPVCTPPDTISAATVAEYTTVALDLPFTHPIPPAPVTPPSPVHATQPGIEPSPAVRVEGSSQPPALPSWMTPAPAPDWSPEHERLLAELILGDHVRHTCVGSMDVTELVQRKIQALLPGQVSSAYGPLGAPVTLEGAGLPTGGAISSGEVPLGPAQRRKGFWFSVNAEVVIYGATEPDAKVACFGCEVPLRPDGTFSFRFALPDGAYELPITAVSATGDDRRSAHFRFGRHTDYGGEVGAHPQDPRLSPPPTR